MKADGLFFVCQKAFIEKDGKVLVIFDPIEGLDFPGGKIQDGELKSEDVSSVIKSLKREVKEETGLEIEVSDPFFVSYYEYSQGHRNHGKGVYLTAFKGRHLSGEVKLSDEHDGFRWVDKSDYHEVNDGSEFFAMLAKYFNAYSL
jgi:8-oxo-dGTP diphosphatase